MKSSIGEGLIGVGVLGCGPIAQMGHLEAVVKAKNATLAAVCDVAPDLADELGTRYAAGSVYSRYDDMLSDPAVELVLVAVDDALHVEYSMAAIKAQKHVLVEKPVGVSVQRVLQLKQMVDAGTTLLQVGHMKRFDPALVYARDFVRSQIGEIIAIRAWYCDSSLRYDMTDSTLPILVTSPLAKDKPRPTNRGHYYLRAHGSHLVDLCQYLVGPFASLTAQVVEKNQIYNWFVQGTLSNGSNAQLDLTVAIREDWSEGFVIYGTKGTVSGNIFNPWYHKTAEVSCYSEEAHGRFQPLDNKANCFQLQIEAVSDCILNGIEQRGTHVDEALTGLKTLIAIDQSCLRGGMVNVAGVEGELM
ncbi:MAG: Gfo/Idh/MocA family oxidoreductase [Saprospiraceae bacterium]|nr:Gfo/Idh/MocA family oxidoreductase [Saprospiraceae bacterium]